jgi:uncharacterized paraquat-inducible protein A
MPALVAGFFMRGRMGGGGQSIARGEYRMAHAFGCRCPECGTFIPLKMLEDVPTTLKCPRCGETITHEDIEQEGNIQQTLFTMALLIFGVFVILAMNCRRH